MGARTLTYDTAEADEAERIGRLLRQSRLLRNISQEEMARRIGVTRKTYAALEKGSPAASLGAFIRTLDILGYRTVISTAIRNAPVGEEIAAVVSRQRAGATHGSMDF